MRHALLLTGTVGAGKTTLAKEAGEVLRAAGVAHAVIELDWLAWCSPPDEDAAAKRQLVLANLRSLLSNYERAGIERFVVAGSIVSPEHLQAIDQTLGAELSVVLVTAPADVIARRVDQRDPGSKTIGSLADTAAFDQRVRDAVPACPSVSNDATNVVEAARSVLEAAGWSGLLVAR